MVETDTQLIEQIQNNFISYFRLFAGLPGVTFVEEDATWFCNSGAASPATMFCAPSLSPIAAEEEIDRLLARIGEQAK